MDFSTSIQSRQVTPKDVGTLWTLRRGGHRARCALMAWPRGGRELRVLVDGDVVLAERCPRGDEAFVLAEVWKARMFADGWRQIQPGARAWPRIRTPRIYMDP